MSITRLPIFIAGLAISLVGCSGGDNGPTGPSVGTIAVAVTTTGVDFDPDGYSVALTGGSAQALGVNASVSFLEVPTGSATVTISGLAPNCSVANPSATAVVERNATENVSFAVTCAPNRGSVAITVTATGVDLDADGYLATIGSGTAQVIPASGALTVANVAVGSHTVTLSGLAPNCSMVSGSSSTAVVFFNATAPVAFSVNCVANLGTISVTAATTGMDFDPNGYTLSLTGGTSQTVGVNATTSFTNVPVGSRTLTISDVAPNCTVAGGTSRTVTVVYNASVATDFAVTCVANVGSVAVTTTSSGTDIDPDGYTVTLSTGATQAVGSNATVTMTGVSVGARTATLSGLAPNCSVTDANPKPVTVSYNVATPVSFAITCVASVGRLEVRTVIEGANQDADGYSLVIDGMSPVGLSSSGVQVIESVPTGNRTLTLSSVAPNCTLNGANPRTAAVAFQATTAVTFSVTCAANVGRISVTTSTTGSNVDNDNYSLVIEDMYENGNDFSTSFANNGTSVIQGVFAGAKTVRLGAVVSNCTVTGGASRVVNVTYNTTSAVTFDVVCAATGTVIVRTVTTGSDVDMDAYTATLENMPPVLVADGTGLGIERVVVGTRTLRLSGLTTNCTVTGGAEKSIVVAPDQITDVTFAIVCVPRTLVFASDRDSIGGLDLYTVRTDGSNLTRLTTHPGLDRQPSWSPDGTRIAFNRVNGSSYEIFVINSDGTNERQLTNSTGSAEPRWSADGSKIVFSSFGDGGRNISIMNADGTGVKRLTFNQGQSTTPDIAPDGKILFQSDRDGGWELYIMNSDGTGVTALTDNANLDINPSFLSDGTRIIFASDRTGNYEIYTMATDGTAVFNRSNHPSLDLLPRYSSDRRIAFVSERNLTSTGTYRLWVMDGAGAGAKRVTSDNAHEVFPDWKP